jgi:hypothetical protein
MDKTGHWVFGADQTEVEDDSTWAVIRSHLCMVS